MRLLLVLMIIFLSSCESLFFEEYKIKAYKFKKKEDNLYYTVSKGDNLYLISKQYNVTISKLINFNNIDSPYKIFPNQKWAEPDSWFSGKFFINWSRIFLDTL